MKGEKVGEVRDGEARGGEVRKIRENEGWGNVEAMCFKRVIFENLELFRRGLHKLNG